MKNLTESQQKMLDIMYNLVIEKTHANLKKVLFYPTKEQQDRFWCKICCGFHNTKDHKKIMEKSIRSK